MKHLCYAGAFLLLAVGMGGCGAGPEEKGGSESHQALDGGQTTTSRMEIGQFSDAVRCTATLISNRHILTAAHCINYEPLHSGGSFTMTNNITVPLKRSFAIGDSGPGAKDLAVGELASPISSSVATPAVIATVHPPTPLLETVFGYGCNEVNPSFNGFKQFFTFTWNGGNTNFNCPGDSGGPRVVGNVNGLGAILGVNSGIHSATGVDIVANAITYRNHIMSLVTATQTGNICYRASIQGSGWQPAVCDGQAAGTFGQSLAIEAIQIWSNRPGVSVCYNTALQGIGWQGTVCNGQMAGTLLQSRRMEAITITVSSGTVQYNASLQDIGWQGWKLNGAVAGTTGQSRRLEGLAVLLSP